MGVTLVVRRAVVERQVAVQDNLEVWLVNLDGQEAEAVVYPALVGKVSTGDFVLINTTAVDLELGTGGQHVVIALIELGGPMPPAKITREEGHIIKLRYTPLQCRVLAAEEEASPYYDAIKHVDRLPGTPVICMGLHSQLGPAAAGVKAVDPNLRVAYIMTDSAALPMAYSRLVHQLTAAGLIDVTITTGQAFGGDLETVNPYSAMVTAVVAGKADVIIAGQGPGNVGTHSALGFGGVEQAQLINAAAALEGVPIAIPRISFADPRDRHQGISHHTMTVLRRLALAGAVVPMPHLMPAQSEVVLAQWQREELGVRHRMQVADGEPGIFLCQTREIPLRSMGRRYEQDPAFFQAAAAAGRVAGELAAHG